MKYHVDRPRRAIKVKPDKSGTTINWKLLYGKLLSVARQFSFRGPSHVVTADCCNEQIPGKLSLRLAFEIHLPDNEASSPILLDRIRPTNFSTNFHFVCVFVKITAINIGREVFTELGGCIRAPAS